MASVQCDNFIGNAWKKDLCLNCFRGKEEHLTKNGISSSVAPTSIPDPPKEGILKRNKSQSIPKKNKVIFLSTECEVIGFGGDDTYSEDDYPDCSAKSDEVDDSEDSEEDRAFQKLTKSNTDYNSIPENLQEPKEGEVKKLIEPLKLGKQVYDGKGNKKTLLVSVTPFGDQTVPKNKMNGFKVTSITKDKLNGEDPNKSFKSESNVPIKVRSVFEKTEIDTDGFNGEETSEKTFIWDRETANIEKSEDDTSPRVTSEKSLKRSQPLDKNFKLRLIKDFQKENEKHFESNEKGEPDPPKSDKIKTSEKVNGLIDKARKKVNQFPVITDNPSFKLRPSDPLNLKSAENDKAVVLDIYSIGENEDVKAHNEINEEKTMKGSREVKVAASSDTTGQNHEKLSNESVTKSVNNSLASSVPDCGNKGGTKNIGDGVTIDRPKLIPNVSSLYRHHFKSVPSNDESMKSDISSPVVKPLMNGVISCTQTLLPDAEYTFLDIKQTNRDRGYEFKEITPEKTEIETKEENFTGDTHSEMEVSKNIKFKKISFENFENIIEDEEITLFSAENGSDASRGKENPLEVVEAEADRTPEDESPGQVSSCGMARPPALPSKPPPSLPDSRIAFLQDSTTYGDGAKAVPEKPRVPAKPIIIQSKRTNFQSPSHTNRPKSPSIEKFLDVSSSPRMDLQPPLLESPSSDSSRMHKRPAPKPPSPKEDASQRFVAVMSDLNSSELQVMQRDSEELNVHRIFRSAENLLEFMSDREEKERLNGDASEEITVPEPLPRRTLCLSQDSLVPGEAVDEPTKKKCGKGRFFLRKLLHLGKNKDTTKDFSERQKSFLSATGKPKLEIIHPSDLNGSRVEVVPPTRTPKSRRTSSSASSSSGEQRESDVLSDSSASHSVSSSGNDSLSAVDRSKKPPPPPRGHSLDTWNVKPARPPPPKSIEMLLKTNSSWSNTPERKSDSLYVNLGEARCGLAPDKPSRTGSLREGNMENRKKLVQGTTQPEDSDYESFVVPSLQYSTSSPHPEDNLYECVRSSNHRSSLPECDSLAECPGNTYAKGKRSASGRENLHRRSEGNVDLTSDCYKMKFMRSVSLPYCASETESEIYSSYSFYGSELGEEDYDASSSNQVLRMSRLKLKKGRSIVHKNLEDNYGAVVVANHEALAQVVEQMRQGPAPPPALRALSTAVNLRWTDFAIAKGTPGVVVERRVFYPAMWGCHGVTLSLMAEQGLNSSLHARGPFNMNPIAELNDLVPASYLPVLKKNDSELIQASISVLKRLQIETVETFGTMMGSGVPNEESKKEVNFVLLQIINAFKNLQAQGIEEASKNLSNLVVCREEKDPHPRICITDSFERSEDGISLCQCLIHAIKNILPPTDLTPLISSILLREKAVSLSQAKGILEFVLWGPADIAFGNSNRERESALQRWLDLERATVLHGLVRTRAELTVFEEWQLLFLVRTSAKIMAEASMHLEEGFNEGLSAL